MNDLLKACLDMVIWKENKPGATWSTEFMQHYLPIKEATEKLTAGPPGLTPNQVRLGLRSTRHLKSAADVD